MAVRWRLPPSAATPALRPDGRPRLCRPAAGGARSGLSDGRRRGRAPCRHHARLVAVAPGGSSKPPRFRCRRTRRPRLPAGAISRTPCATPPPPPAGGPGGRPRSGVGRRGRTPGSWRQLGRRPSCAPAARRFSGFYPDPKNSGNGLTTPGSRCRACALADLGRPQRRRDAARQWRGGPVPPDAQRVGAGAARVQWTTWWWAPRPRRADRSGRCASGGALGKRTVPHRGARPHAPGGRLGRLAGAAPRTSAAKPLWLTGIGLDTRPGNPDGVSPETPGPLPGVRAVPRRPGGRGLVAWNGLQDRASYLAGFPSIASGLYFNFQDDLARDPPKPP